MGAGDKTKASTARNASVESRPTASANAQMKATCKNNASHTYRRAEFSTSRESEQLIILQVSAYLRAEVYQRQNLLARYDTAQNIQLELSKRRTHTSMRFSTTIGVKPAATIAFKHDFWSILGQMTALAVGLETRSAASVRDKDILGRGRIEKNPGHGRRTLSGSFACSCVLGGGGNPLLCMKPRMCLTTKCSCHPKDELV